MVVYFLNLGVLIDKGYQLLTVEVVINELYANISAVPGRPYAFNECKLTLL